MPNMPPYVAPDEMIESAGWGNPVVDALYDNQPWVINQAGISFGNLAGFVKVGEFSLPAASQTIPRFWLFWWEVALSGHAANGQVDARFLNASGQTMWVSPSMGYLNAIATVGTFLVRVEAGVAAVPFVIQLYINQTGAGANTNLSGDLYGLGFSLRIRP